MSDSSPLFVASDVHGHCDALVEALRERGLVGGGAEWTGGDARLWILGDLFDRGEQGVAVVRLLRRLADEAAGEGGHVDTLIGNHEVLLLGSKQFGDGRFIDVDGQERQFLHWWVLNGGYEADLGELTDDEIEWLRTRRVVHLVGRSLLMHSDTESYLGYGRSTEAVNAAAGMVLASDEPEEWWQLFRELTRRHEFMGQDGPARARGMLRSFGGEELVHGHSTIPDTTGLNPSEVTEARRYCDDLVLNVDGGVYQGGRCLVVRLNLIPPSAGVVESADPLGRARLFAGCRRTFSEWPGRGGRESRLPLSRRAARFVSPSCPARSAVGSGRASGALAPARRLNSFVSHIRHHEAAS